MDLTTPQGVTRLILIRHAEPAEGELSRRGHGQAEGCARWLRAAPIDRIFASPSRWALETAAPLARTLGLEVTAEDAFRGLGDGEGYADLRRRVREATAGLRARHQRETMAIVSHGEVIRMVIAEALNLADADSLRVDQEHCAVNIVDYAGDAPVVRLVNAVP